MNIKLNTIRRFFPYSVAHATNVIKIEDNDHVWYNALSKALQNLMVDEYFNCSEGYFNLSMDNKITVECTHAGQSLYITYWDNSIYISPMFHAFGVEKPVFCTTIHKRDRKAELEQASIEN